MSTENLTRKEALQTLKKISEEARICMFCTDLETLPNSARPMSLKETDEEGTMWFLSGERSNKNFEIKEDNRVQLYFMNNSNSEYLSVLGRAFIYKDKNTIEDKWNPMANAWFDGKDDPNLSVIRVTPEETYYWEPKVGKFVSMLHFAAAAITGNKSDNDDGREGNLHI
jgi:general stress protein 26